MKPQGQPRDQQPQPQCAETHLSELTRLWIRAQPSVAAYVSGMVWNSQDAEDVVQEVAEVCASKFDTFDHSRSFLSWALGIARNQVLRYYQTNARRAMFQPATLELIADEFASRDLSADARIEALRECIKSVTGRARQLLDMRYYREQPATQIAERLGLSPVAVRVALSRVRKALGDCITRRMNRGAHTNV